MPIGEIFKTQTDTAPPALVTPGSRETSFQRQGVTTFGAALACAAALGAALPATGSAAEGNEAARPQTVDIIETTAKLHAAPAPIGVLARAACRRQTEIDPRSYNSCEYPGAYATVERKHPNWITKFNLANPGQEDRADRKTLYWKTNPGDYKLMRLQSEAGMWYVSPRPELWDRVASRECISWVCKTGNGYYWGLQMDIPFMKAHNPKAYALWGTKTPWPRPAQRKAGDDAYETRGLEPWPSSYAAEGFKPVP